jgi:hypothetical protein
MVEDRIRMESFKVCQRVGSDGMLHLNIPVGLVDRDVESVVIYQPINTGNVFRLALDELYGICADDPIVVDDAGVSDVLDENLAGAFE